MTVEPNEKNYILPYFDIHTFVMNGLRGNFEFFIKLFRFQEWVITKYTFNLGLMMAFVLFQGIHPEMLIEPALLYIIYMLPIGAFGYFLNDISDVYYDRKIGKANLSGKIKKPYKLLLLVVLFVIGTLPALRMDSHAVTYLLILSLQVLCLLIYTIPVLRFKAHVGGLFCDALFSYVFPGLIGLLVVSQTGAEEVSLAFMLVIFWLFFTGIRSILSHQIKDVNMDKASGQVTFVQAKGIKPSLRIRKIVVLIELLVFALLVTLMPVEIQCGALAGLLLCTGYEIIFLKNIDFSSFVNTTNISFLNVFYNYFIFNGLCVVFVYHGYWIFLLLLVVFNVERFYSLIQSLYFNIMKWLYYKFKGLIRRIKNIM